MSRRAVVLAVLCWLALPVGASSAGPGDAQDDSPLGISALRSLAEANGHHSNLIADSFRLPAQHGVLFVVEPAVAFSPEDVAALGRWVSDGGTLVYASTAADPVLEPLLGLSRLADGAGFETRATAATPLLSGVGSVQMTAASPLGAVKGAQVVILRSRTDGVVGIEAPLGRGHYFALAASGPLTNGDLANADNGILAADLLAAAGTTAEVSFDQFHHAGGGGGGTLAWMSTPWGISMLLVVIFGLVLLMMRGRVFGPQVPLQPAGDPSSAEFTAAVGAMLRRARARQQTVGGLLAATRAALAHQAGIRGGVDPASFEAALRQRAPTLADELHAVTARAAAVHDEKSMAEVAAELHRLARPPLRPAPGTATNRRK